METREKILFMGAAYLLVFMFFNLMWISSVNDSRLVSEEEKAYEELGIASSDIKNTTTSWNEEKTELTITQKGVMSVISYEDKKGLGQEYSGTPRKIKNVNEFESK